MSELIRFESTILEHPTSPVAGVTYQEIGPIDDRTRFYIPALNTATSTNNLPVDLATFGRYLKSIQITQKDSGLGQ